MPSMRTCRHKCFRGIRRQVTTPDSVYEIGRFYEDGQEKLTLSEFRGGAFWSKWIDVDACSNFKAGNRMDPGQ